MKIWTGIDQLSVVLTGHNNVNTDYYSKFNYSYNEKGGEFRTQSNNAQAR